MSKSKVTVAGISKFAGGGDAAELVEITPAMAREWLTKNHNNRPLKKNRIEVYARDIVEGRWTVNNDAIAFGEDGTTPNPFAGQGDVNAAAAALGLFVVNACRRCSGFARRDERPRGNDHDLHPLPRPRRRR